MAPNLNFNYNMIILSREYKEYNQSELADKAEISRSKMSRIEGDTYVPDDAELKQLSKVLGFPKEFFFQNEERFNPNMGFYRKRKKIPQKTLLKGEAIMNIHRMIIDRLIQNVELPEANLINWDAEYDGDEQLAAQKLRAFWGVGKGKISNVFKLLEDNGILIIPCDFGTEKMDGYSLCSRKTGRPIIFYNKNYSIDRIRMTVIHELGHLVLHFGKIIGGLRDVEKEAFNFASEFLVPRNELIPTLGQRVTLQLLTSHKMYWRISMAGLIMAISKSGSITPNQERYLWQQMAPYRKREPIELPLNNEIPSLYDQVVDAHLNALGYSVEELSVFLRMSAKDLNDLILEMPKRGLKIVRK